jgi:hypothetical protein
MRKKQETEERAAPNMEAKPSTELLAEVFDEMAKYPASYFLTIGQEWCGEEEDRELLFCATLYQRPPDDGWPTQGHYFHSQRGAIHWTLRQPFPWAFDPSVWSAVTGSNAADVARLALGMLKSQRSRIATWELEVLSHITA